MKKLVEVAIVTVQTNGIIGIIIKIIIKNGRIVTDIYVSERT